MYNAIADDDIATIVAVYYLLRIVFIVIQAFFSAHVLQLQTAVLKKLSQI